MGEQKTQTEKIKMQQFCEKKTFLTDFPKPNNEVKSKIISTFNMETE